MTASSAPIAEPDASAPRVDRIASAAVQDTLERISGADLMASGAVNMIGLEAIRRKVGERWPRKAPAVWEHVEREIERTLGPTSVFVRTDDITYLIAMPGEQGFAAQAVCLTILQDVLKFFLGEMRWGDISLRQVTSIKGGAVVSAEVDATSVRQRAAQASTQAERAAEAVSGPLADHAPAPKPWQPPLAGRTHSVNLEPPKREPFKLDFKIEPVWHLRRGIITSFLIDRHGAPTQAEPADLEEMDVATTLYVAKLLEEHANQGGPLALHVPLTFTSLASQRTRERLVSLTRPMREAMRANVLIEIDMLDPGVPVSRLIDVVGLVRTLCGGVLARVRPSKAAFKAASGCGIRGIVADATWLGLTAAGADARLKAYAHLARGIAPNVLVHGLPRPGLIDDATAAGFTHASVAPSANA